MSLDLTLLYDVLETCRCYYFLQAGFKRFEDFPMTFWLALFVEGTRFTQEKLEAAQEYAYIRSLPSPRNVLIPRTKVIFTCFFRLLLGWTYIRYAKTRDLCRRCLT